MKKYVVIRCCDGEITKIGESNDSQEAYKMMKEDFDEYNYIPPEQANDYEDDDCFITNNCAKSRAGGTGTCSWAILD